MQVEEPAQAQARAVTAALLRGGGNGDAPERLEVDDDDDDDDDDGATATHGATTLAPVHQTSDVQIILGCKLIPRSHDGGASSLMTDSYSGSGSASGEEHFSEEATAEDASPASADAAGTSLFALPAPAHAYATRGSGAALITAVSSTAAGGEGADAGIDFSPRLQRRVGVKSGHGRRGSADEPALKVAAAGADFIFPFPTNESPPAPAPVAGAPGMAPHAPTAPPLFGALFGVATAAAHGGAQEAALAAAGDDVDAMQGALDLMAACHAVHVIY